MKALVFLIITVGIIATGMLIAYKTMGKAESLEDVVLNVGDQIREDTIFDVYDDRSEYPEGIYCKRLHDSSHDEAVLIKNGIIRFYGPFSSRSENTVNEQGICKNGQIYIWNEKKGNILTYPELPDDKVIEQCAYALDDFSYECYEAEIDSSIVKRPLFIMFVKSIL